jgi:hypothetical protein
MIFLRAALSGLLTFSPAFAARADAVLLMASGGMPKSYGVLVEAPPSDCAHARFVVSEGRQVLGHTPPLAPGDRAVVRMGARFDEGTHVLTVRATGCQAGTPALSRVVLGKRGPDHGWRAERLMR